MRRMVGVQLADLTVLEPSTSDEKRKNTRPTEGVLHSPKSITFVRSRILYARPALNAKGDVRLGLRHIRKSTHPPPSR